MFRIKLPLDKDVLLSVLYNLPRTDLGHTVPLAIRIIYNGALLLPRASTSWDPHTQPTRPDCKLINDHFYVVIKTRKNVQRYDQSRIINLAAVHDPIPIIHFILCVIYRYPSVTVIHASFNIIARNMIVITLSYQALLHVTQILLKFIKVFMIVIKCVVPARLFFYYQGI